MAITKSAIMLLSYLIIAAASSSMHRNIDGYSHQVDERCALFAPLYHKAFSNNRSTFPSEVSKLVI